MDKDEWIKRRRARKEREKEWIEKQPRGLKKWFIFLFARIVLGVNYVECKLHPLPRLSYYLYGDYEVELDANFDEEIIPGSPRDMELRIKAYNKAVDFYHKNGFCPYQPDNTWKVWSKELKSEKKHIDTLPEGDCEKNSYNLTLFLFAVTALISIGLLICALASWGFLDFVSDYFNRLYGIAE